MNLTVDYSCARADQFLVKKTGRSRTFLKEQIEAGRVTLNGVVLKKSSTAVKVGDEFSCTFQEEKPLDLTPIYRALDIRYEDEFFLILNKARGAVVHPASSFHGETLVHHLLYYFQKSEDFLKMDETRPGIVHRLDRGTSGCLVVAKNRKTQEALSTLFKDRKVQKEYEAIVCGKIPNKGRWDSPVGRDRKNRKKWSSKSAKPRTALTHFERISQFEKHSHVRLLPFTGRTHQLRVHLSENGFPVVGDTLYGGKRVSSAVPLLLHAKRIAFTHPFTEKSIDVTVESPPDFKNYLCSLS